MGTNFHVQVRCEGPCAHCNPPRWHISKSMVMWQSANTNDAEFDKPGPADHVITSVSGWEQVIREQNLLIIDEYGNEHDVDEFFALVRKTTDTSRRRQYEWIQNNYPYTQRASEDWLDGEGFSFTSREFS